VELMCLCLCFLIRWCKLALLSCGVVPNVVCVLLVDVVILCGMTSNMGFSISRNTSFVCLICSHLQ
jgi:hypothetical protein